MYLYNIIEIIACGLECRVSSHIHVDELRETFYYDYFLLCMCAVIEGHLIARYYIVIFSYTDDVWPAELRDKEPEWLPGERQNFESR